MIGCTLRRVTTNPFVMPTKIASDENPWDEDIGRGLKRQYRRCEADQRSYGEIKTTHDDHEHLTNCRDHQRHSLRQKIGEIFRGQEIGWCGMTGRR